VLISGRYAVRMGPRGVVKDPVIKVEAKHKESIESQRGI
jgi:hypothetical protein